MDIEHPDLERIQKLGYPSTDYIEFERQQEEEMGEEE